MGLLAGLTTLVFTLGALEALTDAAWATAHPLGMHGGVWGLGVNLIVTWTVSRFTRPPSNETVARVHGAVERFVYEGDPE